jgi:hypothetical protein
VLILIWAGHEPGLESSSKPQYRMVYTAAYHYKSGSSDHNNIFPSVHIPGKNLFCHYMIVTIKECIIFAGKI